MWRCLALCALLAPARAAGYCATDTLPSDAAAMQFTKEHVPFEFGYEDKFKGIHCCGRGYRSIEWFKDNVAYPWSAGVSNLIQYPEAANQTLYTQRAARSDGGNYTCRISNETHSEQRTIYLEVLEKPPDAPRSMFVSPDQWAEEGGALRLYCEALVGRSYLADARSDLRWRKLWPNDTEGELLPTQREVKTQRDDIEDIIGAYLVFPRVAAPDYGTYVCVVNSNEVVSKSYVTVHYKHGSEEGWRAAAPEPVPWRLLLLGALALTLALLSAAALHRRCTRPLLLAARIAHARATRPHRAAAAEWDVCVCWARADTPLVRGVLLPTLARKYGYRVRPAPLGDDVDTWYATLVTASARCRAVVAALSPGGLAPERLHRALKQLRALPVTPVIVLLEELPKLKPCVKDARGESVADAVRAARPLAWRRVHERAFWTALRLALPLPEPRPPPPPPPTTTTANETGTDGDKCSRSGSLTALV